MKMKKVCSVFLATTVLITSIPFSGIRIHAGISGDTFTKDGIQ